MGGRGPVSAETCRGAGTRLGRDRCQWRGAGTRLGRDRSFTGAVLHRMGPSSAAPVSAETGPEDGKFPPAVNPFKSSTNHNQHGSS